MRPMFAGGGRLAARRSLAFTAPGADGRTGSRRRVVAVKDTRALTQGRHAAQRRAARDPRRAGHVPGLGRRRGDRPRPGAPSCRSPSATRCSDGRRSRCCSPTRASRPARYAHSRGLEQAVADGLTDVPAVHARAHATRGGGRRALAVAARRAATIDALVALDDEWRRAALARRCATQRGDSAPSCCVRRATVWPDDARSRAYREASTATPRPVALGVVGAAAGLDDETVARLSLYDDAATVASAALKLLPLDPADTAALARRAGAGDRARGARGGRRPAAGRRPARRPPRSRSSSPRTAHQQRRERLFAS